ncbi:glycoside hydrolase superfamily [Ilyonectria sp. MPI-CAGE-AT-0026]|nr:glycoside hydrolase superfamily [Ilyonectria sp. MPI-CAGE-AT-0026]
MFKRGVNLGSQFIVELWMAEGSWKEMGCGKYNDEWACVEAIGPTGADKTFKGYWADWTTEFDIIQIFSLGLNTGQTPVGFYIREDLCKNHNFYVIMDLHLVPGPESPNEKFTCHISNPSTLPRFYTPENYERALKLLEWMAKRIHTHDNYTTVVMLEVLNEPVHVSAWMDNAADMSKSWGSGNPRTYLPSINNTLFDAHRCLRYIEASFNDDIGRNVAVGYTLKNTDEFKIDGRETQLRWCNQSAVAAGVIPDDGSTGDSLSPC